MSKNVPCACWEKSLTLPRILVSKIVIGYVKIEMKKILLLLGATELHEMKEYGMCPKHFIPLYQLVLLYNETGHDKEVLALARLIIDKEIPSSTVSANKEKIREFIQK
jgi:hypothetical protein